MIYTFTPVSALLFLTSLFSALIGTVVWRRGETPGARPFALALFAGALWSFFVPFENVAPTLGEKLTFSKIEYIGILSITPLWFLFCLEYTGHGAILTQRVRALLWVIPALTLTFAFSNDLHGLIWREVTLETTAAGLPDAVYRHGGWFWVSAFYNYLMLLLGSVTLIRSVVRFSSLYRQQIVAIFVGTALPWLANILYLTGASPLPNVDPTPFALTLTGAIFAWSIFRRHLFDLAPVAHESLFQSLSDGVVVTDNDGRVIEANRRALTIFNHPQPPIGSAFKSAFPSVDIEQIPASGRAEVPLPNGIYEVILKRFYTLQEVAQGQIITFRDISERKYLERMRDDLMHMIVHDLRNPLAAIGGALELLEEETDPETKEAVDIANTGLRRMTNMVNTILDMQRLEQGVMPLEKQIVHLKQIVNDLVSWEVSVARRKNIRLVESIPDALPPLNLDPRLISRVLQNLIDNALKFTPTGGQVTISAAPDPAKSAVAISVRDTGRGIAPDVQARIFDKFNTGAAQEGRGSGLGLAFCRLVAEAHNGVIAVESTLGEGSTFTLRLPA